MDPEMKRVMELSRVTAQNDELKRMQQIKEQARKEKAQVDKPFNFNSDKIGGDDIGDFNFDKQDSKNEDFNFNFGGSSE